MHARDGQLFADTSEEVRNAGLVLDLSRSVFRNRAKKIAEHYANTKDPQALSFLVPAMKRLSLPIKEQCAKI